MGDDFSEPVKRVLASRVGNLCSNPDCRALTSGPQTDVSKAINLGVAAHLTAASPGGPRYDRDLLPEERSAPANGIWLCQNCSKLVDNDAAQFSLEVLTKWKTAAEEGARDRIGKTAMITAAPAVHLRIGARLRIAPIVPREHEQAEFSVEDDKGEYFVLRKLDSSRQVDLPKSFIEKIHSFGNAKPSLVQLGGRLQWISAKRNFELFHDNPAALAGVYGIGKDVHTNYVGRLGIEAKFAREDRLPQLLAQGWYVYYDLDGTYLRWPGPDVNQIVIVHWV
jgi:hypothetical protein